MVWVKLLPPGMGRPPDGHWGDPPDLSLFPLYAAAPCDLRPGNIPVYPVCSTEQAHPGQGPDAVGADSKLDISW